MKDPLSLRFSAIVGKASTVRSRMLNIMSIRKILSPLLIISYVCGSRVIKFPIGVRRQWFGPLYMLLLWSLYNFVFIYVVIPYTIHYSTLYHIWFGMNMLIAFLSITTGIYYDKAFRNCIKNLTCVDDTLEKLGIRTDYKLYKRTIWLILGWFISAIIITCLDIPVSRKKNDIAQTMYILFIRIYCIHINIINDLTITSMLGYVGLKFDQINEHFEKLINGNKCRIKRDRENSVLFFHQSRCTKAPRNVYMIWIAIHLHSELRKISRKIDLIFGTQMTMEMACFFAFIALDIQEVFAVIFIENYKYNEIRYITMLLLWLFLHSFRLFLINYECERIRIKANATGNFINKLSYFNCDVEIHENILQFLLMIQSPIRFCGLGFFEFGFKFLQRVTISVVTVLVILLQSYIN